MINNYYSLGKNHHYAIRETHLDETIASLISVVCNIESGENLYSKVIAYATRVEVPE